MGKENREAKSSVQVDLMYEDESAEENERSFYNALHEEQLPNNIEIKKLRVENVVYMNFKNDFSFKTGDQVLVLGEHQSTLNNNMPLRELMYIGRVLEQLIPIKDRYRKGQVHFPTPEFYTLYNGKDFMEKEKILKMSTLNSTFFHVFIVLPFCTIRSLFYCVFSLLDSAVVRLPLLPASHVPYFCSYASCFTSSSNSSPAE